MDKTKLFRIANKIASGGYNIPQDCGSMQCPWDDDGYDFLEHISDEDIYLSYSFNANNMPDFNNEKIVFYVEDLYATIVDCDNITFETPITLNNFDKYCYMDARDDLTEQEKENYKKLFIEKYQVLQNELQVEDWRDYEDRSTIKIEIKKESSKEPNNYEFHVC